MERVRVLQVVPNFRPGGAERVAVHLVRGLDPGRFESAAVSLYDEAAPDLAGAIEEGDIRWWRLGKRPGLDPRMWLEFDRVVREFRPHVVNTHLHTLRYVLPAAFLRRVPLVVHTMHNIAEQETDAFGKWLRRAAFPLGVVPVAIADEVAASMRRLYGLRDFPTIPNGIPVADYRAPAAARPRWRAREGYGDHDVLFVCVARLFPAKNQVALVEAFARVTVEGARLLLVGEGDLRPAIEDAVRRLDLKGRVRLAGVRSDIPEVLAASDVFVLPSLWEGNPLCVMEAMAAGLPVVATAVGGVPELVEDGESGMLVPAGDVDALAAAMQAVAVDAGMRARMGRAAAARADERFDASVMARRYGDLYLRLLERRGGSRPGGAA